MEMSPHTAPCWNNFTWQRAE